MPTEASATVVPIGGAGRTVHLSPGRPPRPRKACFDPTSTPDLRRRVRPRWRGRPAPHGSAGESVHTPSAGCHVSTSGCWPAWTAATSAVDRRPVRLQPEHRGAGSRPTRVRVAGSDVSPRAESASVKRPTSVTARSADQRQAGRRCTRRRQQSWPATAGKSRRNVASETSRRPCGGRRRRGEHARADDGELDPSPPESTASPSGTCGEGTGEEAGFHVCPLSELTERGENAAAGLAASRRVSTPPRLPADQIPPLSAIPCGVTGDQLRRAGRSVEKLPERVRLVAELSHAAARPTSRRGSRWRPAVGGCGTAAAVALGAGDESGQAARARWRRAARADRPSRRIFGRPNLTK